MQTQPVDKVEATSRISTETNFQPGEEGAGSTRGCGRNRQPISRGAGLPPAEATWGHLPEGEETPLPEQEF